MQKLEANAWIAFRFRCETGRFRIASPVKNFTWPPKSLYGHRETSPIGFTFTLQHCLLRSVAGHPLEPWGVVDTLRM